MLIAVLKKFKKPIVLFNRPYNFRHTSFRLRALWLIFCRPIEYKVFIEKTRNKPTAIELKAAGIAIVQKVK